MSKSALYEEKRRPRIASPFGYSFLLVVVLILTFYYSQCCHYLRPCGIINTVNGRQIR